MYVLQRDDGKFVAPAGSHRAYTNYLQGARVFLKREQAERERCGNERIVPLEQAIGL